MLLFYIKKNFCDGWDNLFSLFLVNIVIIGIAIGIYFSVGAIIESLPAIGIALQIIGLYLLFTAIFAFGENAANIANFKSVSFKDYLNCFKNPNLWKDSLGFTLLVGIIFALSLFVIPFYLNMGNMVGTFLAAVLFWLLFVFTLAFQWFLPIRSLMNNGFKKCVKKSFLIFFDNPGFSIFVFIYSILLLAMSLFLFFMLPGFSGIVLAHMNALRLRLYKYDWYEENPELSPAQRKHIPWDELLAEDYETLGPRPLKSFIFPWK